MKSLTYRHDIQMLRGVAVVFVTLFHLDFAFMRSGFLGVDVFFVISGFLMAHLYAETNFWEFYIRRANRLLPGYFFVVFATIIYSAVAIEYSDLKQVSSQVLFASTFLSNIGFWLSNSYFSSVEFKPLLHLWSLGIEVQFYVLFPFLCFLYRKAKLAVFALFLSSLILCFLVVQVSPKTSFFLLPFRLWEFLAGFYVAVLPKKEWIIDLKWEKILGVIGLILLCTVPLWPLSGVEKSVVTGHPGVGALIAVGLTCILLRFNLPEMILNSMLGRVFEKIGKYSYSIYLVHFPIIVFFLYEPLQGTRLSYSGPDVFFILLFLISLFSIISFYLFESSSKYNYGLKVYAMAISLSVAVGMVGPSMTAAFFDEKEIRLQEAFFDRSGFRCGKLFRVFNPMEKVCRLNQPVGQIEDEVLLLGNSHADSIKTAFAAVASELNQRLWFAVQNDPLWGEKKSLTPEEIIGVAREKHIKHIVVHYNNIIGFVEIFEKLVELSAKYQIRVSYIMPVPQWGVNVPKVLIENKPADLAKLKKNNSEYMREHAKLYQFLKSRPENNFTYFDVSDVLCNENCKVISADGYPLYFDPQHLTLRGADLLKPVFFKILQSSET